MFNEDPTKNLLKKYQYDEKNAIKGSFRSRKLNLEYLQIRQRTISIELSVPQLAYQTGFVPPFFVKLKAIIASEYNFK